MQWPLNTVSGPAISYGLTTVFLISGARRASLGFVSRQSHITGTYRLLPIAKVFRFVCVFAKLRFIGRELTN